MNKIIKLVITFILGIGAGAGIGIGTLVACSGSWITEQEIKIEVQDQKIKQLIANLEAEIKIKTEQLEVAINDLKQKAINLGYKEVLKDLKTLQELVDDINHKDKAIISDEENEIVNLKKDIDVQKGVLDDLKEKLNDLITIKGDANV